ncbi:MULTISPECIES: GmrSD restriction endonuclease domain-containing protein [unclassified Caulobacter]|uniref:GmrSD restriction endonuclease domain-containing protein n=1 Tax=unclassified Caulobacter TaxID=2648921 RepID=UPI000D361A74|nr:MULTISPECIES: DUF262 domain-containing protein [unclassified Caulobacter]PTS90130.1 DUF262 domain-containing protein [Caulobacter sp. HMWF009]PTT13190.1 DUF262 domain-containing protein [Caulobacter sp. HMWF025]
MSDGWTYDETEESPEDEAYAPLQFEIINFPADTTLRGYLDQHRSGQLVVPKFQRQYVWDVKKASKLIESFLLGLPVPGTFLFRPKGLTEHHIVDGQQRIMSAINFQLERFDSNKIFRLSGVQKQWEGKTFSELSEGERFKLEQSVLRATIIQQLSPDDNTSIYQIFERLNTGGVNLNPMEIRQSVSFGEFVDLLKDLNTNPKWRALIGRRQPDKRLRDVELILRILALLQYRDAYDKPMKEFLNKYMEFKKRNNKDYETLRSSFEQSVDLAYNQLISKPFHLRGKLNYGLLDSVMVALMTNGTVLNLQEKLITLISDKEYNNAISFNTSDASFINMRLHKAIVALK